MYRFLQALLAGALISISPVSADEASSARTVLSPADPELSTFVQLVLATNSRVLAARSLFEAAEAGQVAAERPLYNPELNFDIENADSQTRSVGMSQALDWSNKRQARVNVATSDKKAAAAEYTIVRWDTIVALLKGLTRYQADQNRVSLARSRSQHMGTFLGLTQQRFDAGDLSQIELDVASLAEIDARLQGAETAAALTESRQSVYRLAPRLPEASWPSPGAEFPDSARLDWKAESLLVALPELRAAQNRLDSATAQLELRRRERRADPVLSLTGGKEGDENLVGLNLSIPLNLRNRFIAEVDIAAAKQRQAQQLHDDLLYRSRAQLSGAIERYELSRKAWLDWKGAGKTSLDRQAELLQRLWETGDISSTDYLVQVSQVLDLQQSALDLHQTAWEAWFELLRTSGRLDSWIGDNQ